MKTMASGVCCSAIGRAIKACRIHAVVVYCTGKCKQGCYLLLETGASALLGDPRPTPVQRHATESCNGTLWYHVHAHAAAKYWNCGACRKGPSWVSNGAGLRWTAVILQRDSFKFFL